ncbi:MAG: DUF1841 family protein [Thiohalocapsa sp.]
MFKPDREQIRRVFLQAWRKANVGEPLEPLEQQIVQVVRRHPEYHALLDTGDGALARDWLPEQGETNPFLHMGLHLGLLEQVSTDRPAGIRKLYQQAIGNCGGDVHEAEHRIMECLAEAVWRAQHHGVEPDEMAMFDCIKQRSGGRH